MATESLHQKPVESTHFTQRVAHVIESFADIASKGGILLPEQDLVIVRINERISPFVCRDFTYTYISDGELKTLTVEETGTFGRSNQIPYNVLLRVQIGGNNVKFRNPEATLHYDFTNAGRAYEATLGRRAALIYSESANKRIERALTLNPESVRSRIVVPNINLIY